MDYSDLPAQPSASGLAQPAQPTDSRSSWAKDARRDWTHLGSNNSLTGLQQYLAECRVELGDARDGRRMGANWSGRRRLYVVLGNEAADLDSVVSTLTLAHALHMLVATHGANPDMPDAADRLAAEEAHFPPRSAIAPEADLGQ